MPSYALTCCSTTDLTAAWLDGINVGYLFFNYELDGVPCKDDFGKTHSPKELYASMLNGATAKTSQVSIGEYMEFWAPLLEAGQDVLHVSLSSGISGTYGSACAARDALRRVFPERSLIVIDSLCASAGYGLLVDRMARLRDAGMGLDELASWATRHRLEVQHWFFSSDLSFFVRGGRISKVAGVVGGMLKICPVMNVEADGTLAVKEKIRTKAKAERRVVALMHQLARDGDDYADKVFISNADCLDDARAVSSMIEAQFPQIDGPVHHFDVGATIGCHTGPGTVALFFWGAPRT